MMATEFENWRKYLQKKLQYERRVFHENPAVKKNSISLESEEEDAMSNVLDNAPEIVHSSETSLNSLKCSNVSDSILKTEECNSKIIEDEQVKLANLPLKKRKWFSLEDTEDLHKENPVKRCKN